MCAQRFDWNRFRELPLVGILRGLELSQTLSATRAAVEGGLTSIEITMNSPNAGDQIAKLCEYFGDQVQVGAGTVCTSEDLRVALDAGATFIVTPILAVEVIRECVAKEIPIFPGAMTPTEIYQAWSLGASMVKVFPCDQLGPAFLKNVKAPLPQIPLMPTGGITPENIAEFKAAGADAFGTGSTLFGKAALAKADWAAITNQTRRFVAALR